MKVVEPLSQQVFVPSHFDAYWGRSKRYGHGVWAGLRFDWRSLGCDLAGGSASVRIRQEGRRNDGQMTVRVSPLSGRRPMDCPLHDALPFDGTRVTEWLPGLWPFATPVGSRPTLLAIPYGPPEEAVDERVPDDLRETLLHELWHQELGGFHALFCIRLGDSCRIYCLFSERDYYTAIVCHPRGLTILARPSCALSEKWHFGIADSGKRPRVRFPWLAECLRDQVCAMLRNDLKRAHSRWYLARKRTPDPRLVGLFG